MPLALQATDRDSSHELVPVATGEWEGFIFFCLDAQPRQTLSEYLGGLGEALAGYPFARGPSESEIRMSRKLPRQVDGSKVELSSRFW